MKSIRNIIFIFSSIILIVNHKDVLEWYDKTVINIVVSNFGFAIANSYIVSVVFIVSIIAVAITLYKIRYKSQESVLLFCTASTLTGLVILSEEKKYADTFVPYFSYYTLFSILLLIFTIIELAKLLNSLTDEYPISNYKHNYLGIIGSDTHPETTRYLLTNHGV